MNLHTADMERLRSQLALAAFLQEVGEAVEQAELVCVPSTAPAYTLGDHDPLLHDPLLHDPLLHDPLLHDPLHSTHNSVESWGTLLNCP